MENGWNVVTSYTIDFNAAYDSITMVKFYMKMRQFDTPTKLARLDNV